VTEVKAYVKALPDKLLSIRNVIKEAMGKMTLLDHHFSSMKEDEIKKTWISFSKPLLIFEAHGECEERLEKMADDYFLDLRVQQNALSKEILEI